MNAQRSALMSARRQRALIGVGALITTAVTPLFLSSTAAAAPTATTSAGGVTSTTRAVHSGGTTTYHAGPTGPNTYARGTELPKSLAGPDSGRAATRQPTSPIHRSLARSQHLTVQARATATGSTVVRTGSQLLQSFQGLNHRDTRTANGGNQYSNEPPDQGLCVGNGHVVEAVNDAVRVYATAGGAQTGVEDLNTFFGYPPAVNRSTGVTGPFVTDPSCLYDPTTNHFFLAALTLATDGNGNFTGQNQIDVAVTADPTGSWTLYSLDVTDDGTAGTPVHPHCPCIGDYPHIGVDANGFYITTNEYSFFGPEYNGAQVYAFSKRALASGATTVYVTQWDTSGAVSGNPGFTIWPAQSPTAAQYSTDRNGTEYFLSSNAAPEANGTGTSSSIVVWALTNTSTVGTRHPSAQLINNMITVNPYSIPPASDQKNGSAPLKDCLNNVPCATFLNGEPDSFAPETLAALDSNDSRMQQVTFANGLLYGALDTGITLGTQVKAGIAYYVVSPSVSKRGVSASITTQGTVGVAGNNLTYPAIGITSAGKGLISFTLVGADYYPSAAFASFDAVNGAGAIQRYGVGAGPADGFSDYKYYGAPPGTARPRWGDYGATAVSGDTIWAAAEYIGQSCTLGQYEATPFGSCGGTRTALANWATRVGQIRP